MQPTADQGRAQRPAGRKIAWIVNSWLAKFLIVGLFVRSAAGQSGVSGKFTSRAWTIMDGLPNNSITSVLQSSDGFLWVGTQGGLARFDGVTFRKISLIGARDSNIRVTDLCENLTGRIYAGTQDGLLCYANDRLTRVGDRHDSITSLAAGLGSDVWIGSQHGLVRWDGERFQTYSAAEGLPQEAVVSVFATRAGKVWITLRSGVYVLTDGRIEKYHLSSESQSRTPEFLGVYEDREHEIWAFGDSYLIRLPEGKRFNYFHSGHLASVSIWSFREGRDGRLWIGTSGQGLFQFTDERFRPVDIQSGKRPSNVRSICEDFEGNLWLGTDGGGLVQLRQEPLRLLGAAEGLPSSSALCIVDQAPNNVLISYADGRLFSGVNDHFEPYRLMDPTEIQPFARSVCVGPDGNIWVASSGLGMSCLHEHRRIGFNSANGLSGNFVTYACASSDGNVWAGTRSGDIYRYTTEGWQQSGSVQGGVTTMLARATNQIWAGTASGSVWRVRQSGWEQVLASNDIPGAYVSCLQMDAVGRLWAGAYGGGLRCYDPSSNKTWTSGEELPDKRICGFVFDGPGNLWLATPKGVLLGSKRDVDVTIGKDQPLHWRWAAHLDEVGPGLPGGPTSLLSHDGFPWFVVGGRVMVLNSQNTAVQERPPPVYIEGVRVNGLLRQRDPETRNQNPETTERARINPGVRTLEFEFTSPCLTLPEKARFRYKLEGFDPDWTESSSQLRRVRYGAIPPGPYCFRVYACNADGTWSQTDASFAFLVPTPLWRSPWAVFFYLVSLAAITYMTSRYISHRLLRHRLVTLEHSAEMSRERMRIAQDMHDEIGSKLARISYLVEGVKTELKGVYSNIRLVDSLAKTSRDLLRSLDQMVWAVNPRNDSLEQLAVYLCRQAADFFQDTSILCEFQVPEHLPAAPLSAEVRHNLLLAFQEVLTNVMKHSGADRVTVKINCDSGFAQIEVTDNGRGFDSASPADPSKSRNVRGGQGIPGLKRRLETLRGQCAITSSIGHGTKVSFRIPLSIARSL